LAGNYRVGLILITGYHDWPMGANATNYMFQAGCRAVVKREENLNPVPFIFRMARKGKSRLAARHIQATSSSYDPEAEVIRGIRNWDKFEGRISSAQK
jgi:hypothetical protein